MPEEGIKLFLEKKLHVGVKKPGGFQHLAGTGFRNPFRNGFSSGIRISKPGIPVWKPRGDFGGYPPKSPQPNGTLLQSSLQLNIYKILFWKKLSIYFFFEVYIIHSHQFNEWGWIRVHLK